VCDINSLGTIEENRRMAEPNVIEEKQQTTDKTESSVSVTTPLVEFNLTGFGEFNRVKNNPTETLMKTLPSYLRDNPLPKSVCADVHSCTVLETSGMGSKQQFHQLAHSEESLKGKNKRVWIHFGVDARSTVFRLESRAFNEASFRCADQRGWQPDKQCIVEPTSAASMSSPSCASSGSVSQSCNAVSEKLSSNECASASTSVSLCSSSSSSCNEKQTAALKSECPLSAKCVHKAMEPLYTTLPIDALVKDLSAKWGTQIGRSEDAGRFVCNWIYYLSLTRSVEEHSQSLFVHVPPHAVISLESQQAFARDIIVAIHNRCSQY